MPAPTRQHLAPLVSLQDRPLAAQTGGSLVRREPSDHDRLTLRYRRLTWFKRTLPPLCAARGHGISAAVGAPIWTIRAPQSVRSPQLTVTRSIDLAASGFRGGTCRLFAACGGRTVFLATVIRPTWRDRSWSAAWLRPGPLELASRPLRLAPRMAPRAAPHWTPLSAPEATGARGRHRGAAQAGCGARGVNGGGKFTQPPTGGQPGHLGISMDLPVCQLTELSPPPWRMLRHACI
jgi:hypothetical protein